MTFFQSHVTLQRWRHQSLRKIPKFHPILLVWKLCGIAQNFHTIKLGEISVFYVVSSI